MSQILTNVHMIDDSNGSNVYIIIDDGVTLIDTGMNKNVPKVMAELQRLGFGPDNINNIIITHAHVDHYQCLAQLKMGTKARVLVGEADADVVEGKASMPLPKGAIGLMFRLMRPMMRIRPVKVDVRLKNGDMVDVLGGLKVIGLPGHTPGNIGLHQSQMKLVFSSDTVGHRKDQLQLPFFYKENPDECKAAIKRLYELDADIMLPGHGSPIQPNASQKVQAFYKGLS